MTTRAVRLEQLSAFGDLLRCECVLRECDPKANAACEPDRICYPENKGLTKKGALCLSVCDPKASKCLPGDLCQPLPEDVH